VGGTGTLGGTLTGTILANTNTVTVTGVTYPTAQIGVTIRATQTSGTPSLTPGTSAAFTVVPGPAIRLDINTSGIITAPVTSPPTPTAGTAFQVVVTAEDSQGNASNVTQATSVVLSRAGGNGTLGGTLTGTILGGTNFITISGVTYTKAEGGVAIGADRTSGDVLTNGTSDPFTVNPGTATKLAITSVNGGSNPSAGTAFSVVVQSQDTNGNAANVTPATGVALSLFTGTGTLAGTLAGTIANNQNSQTIAGVTYTKAEGGVVIRATRTSGMTPLAAGNSLGFTVNPGAATQIVFSAQPASTASMLALNSPTGVKVEVRDANANVVTTDNTRNVTVAIGTNPSGGTLGGTKTVTVSAGVATFTTLTIDKSGNGYTLTATSSPALTTPTSSSFNIAVGSVARLAFTTVPVGAIAGSNFSVTVQSQDAGGNPANVTSTTAVTLSAPGFTGALGGTLIGSIANGANTATGFGGITYTKAESLTLTASAAGGIAGTSAPFAVSAAAATKLAVTSVNGGTSPIAGITFSVVVQAQDTFGNPSGVTGNTNIAVARETGTGSLSGTATGVIATGTNSQTIGPMTYTKAESGVSLTATRSSGGAALTLGTSALFTVIPGAATQLFVFAQPANTQSATVINSGTGGIKVQILDSNANLVTSDNTTQVTLAIGTNPGGGTLSGTATVAAVGGVATFTTLSINKIGTGYTLTASSTPALTTPTSSAFNITIGPVAQVGIATIASQTAGVAFSVTVQSQDAGGNPAVVAGITSVSLSAPGFTGTLGGTLTGSIANGASTATGLSAVTYTKAESLTLTATKTVGPDALAAGTSAPFTVNPGPAIKLAVTSVNGGSSPSAGTGFTVVVESQDANDNPAPVTSATTLTLGLGTGSSPGFLGGTLAGAIANGASTATGLTGVTYAKAENITLTATQNSGTPALTVGTSALFTVIPGPTTQMVFVTQPATAVATSAIGGAGGVKVELRDVFNNVATLDPRDVTIGIGTNAGSPTFGTLSGTMTVATVNGVATFIGLNIDKVGTGYTLAASSSPALTTPTSAAFNITLGPLSQLGVTSVNSGTNPTAGIAFAVVVQPQDAGGNAVDLTGAIGFTLGVGTGTGTLGGTLTGTIASGANTATMSGLTYTKAESGVTLVATQTSGTPALTRVPSAPFTVISGLATKLAVTTINGGVLNPVETVAFAVVVQSQDANGNPANVVAATNITLAKGAGTGTVGGTTTGTLPIGANTVTVSAVTYSKGETGVTITATRTSGDTLSVGTSAAFTVNAFATPGAELIQNGDFAGGTTSWQVFQAPDIVSSVASGVFRFFKANPTTTTSGVASVFQETSRALPASAPVLAQFDLGNSTTARKRISVVVADADLTDLAACTFELPAGAPARTYRMLAHTTRLVTNASLRFYAEDAGADGGNYLLDNVSLKYIPSQSALWTACVDPTRPAVASGTDSATNLLTNGDFGTGTLAAWSVAGGMSLQLTAGVLEFIRPAQSTPAAVVFQGADVVSQSTGQAMAAGQILTATVQLGNSSTVRKRVTLRLSEADLSDQTACTFWVPPSQGLLTYTMRGFASIAWTSATLSVLPETVGLESWIQLDNATLRRTSSYPVAGLECIEPVPGVAGGIAVIGDAAVADAPTENTALDSASTYWLGTGGFARAPGASHTGTGLGWRAEAWTTGRATLLWAQPIDLTNATSARLNFESWLSSSATSASGGSSGAVQVCVDGVVWQTIATVPRTDGWTQVDVDFSAFAGRLVYVRFVFDAVAPGAGVAPDVWRIDDVTVMIGGLAGRQMP
jgi:hypothetical protein